jgi:NCAIR mutase (PurE)-related protein
MNVSALNKYLEQFKNGEITAEALLEIFKAASLQTLEFANIDHHREIRQGFPEVVLCERKTPEQVLQISKQIFERHGKLLATRATPQMFALVQKEISQAEFNAEANCIHSPFPDFDPQAEGKIAIITAGTSDIKVAEEAAVTCRLFAYNPLTFYDVGVAGLHRLNHYWEEISRAQVLIVAAGMEGALASVVGGLVDKPVIAIPTSVGYGTSFGGLTALFAMLNSCSSNVTVVNIDNGFGAGFTASLILRQILKED